MSALEQAGAFRTTRLKFVATLASGGTPPVDDARFWESEDSEDGYPWAAIADITADPQVRSTQRRVSMDGVRHGRLPLGERGTLLFAMYASLGATGRLSCKSSWNQAILGITPKGGHSSRFIEYSLARLRPRLKAWARSNTQDNLNAGQVGNLSIPAVRYADQVVVAEFLDRECERTQRLVSSSLRLLAHMEASEGVGLHRGVQAFGAELERHEDEHLPVGWNRVLLSQILRELTNGFVGPTRDLLVDDGVRYIQSTHIKRGGIDFDRRPFFVPNEWHSSRPRVHLRKDDVLIVQTGKLGEVALVPEGFGEASCHALLIARVNDAMVSGPYLASWFRSHYGRAELLKMATGALHPHLEAGEIRRIRILIPPRELQDELVQADNDERGRVSALSASVRQMTERLAEYRDALITEAVTGQLDISGMSEARMDERAQAALEGTVAE